MHFTLNITLITFAALFIAPLNVNSFVHAFLYENGTCTNEKINETSKHIINTNGTVDDFLRSLPSDNTILAEIVCQEDITR